ncbi:MAG: 30S ribosomal protein S30e [Candidatus Thorarchaeota archaeon]
MPGSHGSLAKAGKVRNQTPKVEAKVRHSPIPRVRNKKNYIKRVLTQKNTRRGRSGRPSSF